MFSALTTKIALKKAGLPSNALDVNSWTGGGEPAKPARTQSAREAARNGDFDDDDAGNAWPAWMSIKSVSVPMTMQSWLSPPPPPVPVAKACPNIGDLAPLDRDRKLRFGGGRPTLLVFLRCVGCACTLSLPVSSRPCRHAVRSHPSQSRKRPSSPSAPSP